MTFTLPKWAVLILCIIILPGASTAGCVLLFINSDYNWPGFFAGVLAAIALRDAWKLKRMFFNGQ